MSGFEIPLSADNQRFSIRINAATFTFRLLWRDGLWILDLNDAAGLALLCGVPLVTGSDLLAQYGYLGLGFALRVSCDDPTQELPSKTDPGSASHLLVFTEPS